MPLKPWHWPTPPIEVLLEIIFDNALCPVRSIEWVTPLAAVVGAGAAVYAAYNGIRALQHQRDIDDVRLSYDILREVATYWDEMIADEKNRKFHIGQILTNFEYAASLFNRQTLNEEASEILSQYMQDTITGFERDEDAHSFLEKLRSDDKNLSHLAVFLRRNQSN
ncbi:MAG: hypothetical protein WA957_02345 [Alteraurantiacibacter sp.]